MSRYICDTLASLAVYTPGEQPQGREYIKLNTNESPYPPTPGVISAAGKAANTLNLYCDPECRALREAAAESFGVGPENVLPVNGSDEILYFAFRAFGGAGRSAVFADITYGFYPVYAAVTGTAAVIKPLKPDYTLDPSDYIGADGTVFIANPNAPTGIALPVSELERIIAGNPDNVVVIDEAYVEFGAESCIGLIRKYRNLLVTRTFSKSHSLAGARLGFGVASEELIADLNKVKYSLNPYNVNSITQAIGIAAFRDGETFDSYCKKTAEVRGYLCSELVSLGFSVLPSIANFVFAEKDGMSGEELYLCLKERGVLVRHFASPRIKDRLRITVGTREQTDKLIAALKDVLSRKDCDYENVGN